MTGLSGLLVYTLNTSSYSSAKNVLYPLKRSEDLSKDMSGVGVSRIRTALRKGAAADQYSPVSVVDSMQLYSQNLKKQRTRTSETMLEKRSINTASSGYRQR